MAVSQPKEGIAAKRTDGRWGRGCNVDAGVRGWAGGGGGVPLPLCALPLGAVLIKESLISWLLSRYLPAY